MFSITIDPNVELTRVVECLGMPISAIVDYQGNVRVIFKALGNNVLTNIPPEAIHINDVETSNAGLINGDITGIKLYLEEGLEHLADIIMETLHEFEIMALMITV